MNLPLLGDTIVAQATPPGEGALAIIRLSGPEARLIGGRLAPGSAARQSHRLYQVSLKDGHGCWLDDAMVAEMCAPRSYTGDDVVELYVHGARPVVHAVMRACQQAGARLATPGEFTLRAFLNGRLDLVQAEAVGDLIASGSERERQQAGLALRGELSLRVTETIDHLELVLADWQAAIDFPEHASGEGFVQGHISSLASSSKCVRALLEGTRRRCRGGRRVVLCGAPNVGKSTLLNAWLGEERVVVDSAPGTTRDPVEVELETKGIFWSAWDTAGLHATQNRVEQRGIALSRQQIGRADFVLWLITAAEPVWPADDLLPGQWNQRYGLVGAKMDCASSQQREALEADASRHGHPFLGWIGANEGAGIWELQSAVVDLLVSGDAAGAVLTLRERHVEALEQALASLEKVQEGIASKMPLDALSFDLTDAVRSLGSILGRDVGHDVLEQIFSRFCIGK